MRILPFLLGLGLFIVGCQSKVEENAMDLGNGVSIYDPQELTALLNAQKISEEQRRLSISSLRTAFKASYVGYELKKSLIGLSGDEIFAKCLDKTTVNPLSNTEFYDEVRKCLALFKDTHIYVNSLVESAWLTTGVAEAGWVGDRLTIFSTRPKLLTKLEEVKKVPEGTFSSIIKKGAWIVEINGRPALENIQELEAYVSASSPLAARYQATMDFFTRSYAYPKEAGVTLKIRPTKGSDYVITLPWVQWSDSGSMESRQDLESRGLLETDQLAEDSITGRQGFALDSPLFSELDEKLEYFLKPSKDSKSVLLVGLATIKEQKVCYLQLKSFNLDEGNSGYRFPVYYEEGPESFTESGLIDVLNMYLRNCEMMKQPVIWDLRNNGGDARLAAEIFALFETSSETQVFQARASSAGPGNLAVALVNLSDLNPKTTMVESELYLQAYQEAQKNNTSITPWVLQRSLNFETAAFTGPVVVLTSPQCVSACDNTARRFKATGRGLLVGEPTNGTGFGSESGANASASFRDPFNLYSVNIPNSAFQSVVLSNDLTYLENSEQKGLMLPFEQITPLENHPTLPDVEVHLTPRDLADYGDYIEALVPLLKAGKK